MKTFCSFLSRTALLIVDLGILTDCESASSPSTVPASVGADSLGESLLSPSGKRYTIRYSIASTHQLLSPRPTPTL